MKPVVDIISDVVTAMKPGIRTLSYSISGTYITFTTTDTSILRRLFVGEKVKVTGDDGVIYYGVIDTIVARTYFRALFSALPSTVAAISSAALVINYHYGHPLEIVNLFKQATHSETVKYEQFPAICLMQDFPEEFSGVEREAKLNIVILTDTKREYEASQRYTYTFKPILYPLYDLFMDMLSESDYLYSALDHTRTDRLYWGKSGLYGNTGNIFNDFIDAIEIENLKVKILKTC